MKNRIFIPFCVALFYVSPVLADDTPLAKQMELLDDAYKAFRKTEDPAVGAEKAREAQAVVAKALLESPEMLAKMPESPVRAKASASYRLLTGQLYVKLCEVEQAFLEGRVEKVAELVNDIKELKKTGHNEFMEDE